MIKVSIVVPVYNVEIYLRECLDSLINQTLKDIEIICVNDGSTDNGPNILADYQKKDSRIKIISKPNSGYGHTMNVGMDAASGEYIGIVESDDYVPADMYEVLYKKAKEKDVDIVRADFYRFKVENGIVDKTRNYVCSDKTYYNKIHCPKEDVKVFNFLMNTWCGIYRTAFIKDNNIRHNESPGASFQDNGLFFLSLAYAESVYYLDQPFYMNRRDNPNSSVYNKQKIFCICDEFAYSYEFLNSNPDLKEKLIFIHSHLRFRAYEYSYHHRIPDMYKKVFLKRFADDFRDLINKGEVDESYFSKQQWNKLERILEDIEEFYCSSIIEREIRPYREENKRLKKELRDMQNSLSFRVGRKLTYVPRKIRDLRR